MHVDAAVARLISALPWARFETLLTAKIIEADPRRSADERAKIWEAERFVRAGRTGQSGLKFLIAKANAGDVIWFMATLNRIAEILRLQGDLESARCSSIQGDRHPGPARTRATTAVGVPERTASHRRTPAARRADRQCTEPAVRILHSFARCRAGWKP